MPKPRYLRIKNFEHYQHYKTRNPPWIKLYYSLLDDEKFVRLSLTDRALYVHCLLLQSHADMIPNDPEYLRLQFRLPDIPDLTPLIQAKFLLACSYRKPSKVLASSNGDASKTLSQRQRHNLLSEEKTETERERESERVRARETDAPAAVGLSPSGFPVGWKLEGWMRESCESLGLNAPREFAQFKTYHVAHGSKFADWSEAWKLWMRRGARYQEAKA